MIKKENKNAVRQKRHLRVRAKVSGTAEMPRLNVYRSTSNIYVQIIDDEAGNTLVSSSTIAKGMNVEGMTKTEAAKVSSASSSTEAAICIPVELRRLRKPQEKPVSNSDRRLLYYGKERT